MIKTVIKERLELNGTNKARVAENLGLNIGQFGNVLNDENTSAAITLSNLYECFKILGINIDVYHNRFLLMKNIAEELVNKGLSPDDVAKWSKIQMIKETGEKKISGLLDVPDLKDWTNIFESDLVDMESTYPMFLANVVRWMNVIREAPDREKATPKQVYNATKNLPKPDKEKLQSASKNDPSTATTVATIFAAAIPVLGLATTLLLNSSLKKK